MAQEFFRIGNHLCLDFLNTEAIERGERVDLLRDPEDLQLWLTESGLRTEAQVNEETLQRVRAFRAVLRRGMEQIAETRTVPAEMIEAVNERLKKRVGYPQVVRSEQGGFRERFTDQGGSDGRADYILGLLAEAAADLLCRADLSLIRRCENPQCILFFYDISKNHARRWCSMGACGNRAKAAAHYRRTRSG